MPRSRGSSRPRRWTSARGEAGANCWRNEHPSPRRTSRRRPRPWPRPRPGSRSPRPGSRPGGRTRGRGRQPGEVRGGHCQAGAKRSLSEKQFERIKALFAAAGPRRTSSTSVEHDLQAAQAGEALEPGGGAHRRGELAASEARSAKADLDEARSMIRLVEGGRSDTHHHRLRRIVAPFDGVVTSRLLPPGGLHPLGRRRVGAATADRDAHRPNRIIVQVPDLDVALLDVGDPATVVVDSLRGRCWRGPSRGWPGPGEPDHAGRCGVEVEPGNPRASARGCTAAQRSCSGPRPRAWPSPPVACWATPPADGKVSSSATAMSAPPRLPSATTTSTTTEVLSGVGADDSVVLNPQQRPRRQRPGRRQPHPGRRPSRAGPWCRWRGLSYPAPDSLLVLGRHKQHPEGPTPRRHDAGSRPGRPRRP